MAVIYRGASSFPETLGFIQGFGLKQGAVATSLSWDCNNLVVLGPNECDMAAAVNRLRDVGGGMVFSLGEEIVVEIPLPIAGIMSDKPLDELACEINEFEEALKEMGCPLPRPFLALQTLPFTGLPFYRLTDRGLLDIRRCQLLPVVME
jgi:adenine deaminase